MNNWHNGKACCPCSRYWERGNVVISSVPSLSFISFFFPYPSLSSPLLSLLSLLPFSGTWHKMTHKSWHVIKPQHNQSLIGIIRIIRIFTIICFQITIGRATKDNQIDVDLSLEGPAWKISRRQGAIKLRNNGDFYIANEGKRPLYIDGKPILTGNKQKLNNNSVVEVSISDLISSRQ